MKSQIYRRWVSTDFSIAMAIFLVAWFLRLAHSFLVAFPSNDGVHYLRMAEDFANAQFADGMRCTFHPGSALLHTPIAYLFGFDSYVVARIVNAFAGAFACVFVFRAAGHLAGHLSALMVAVLFAASFPAIRVVADNYSESCYLFFIALALLQALQHQYMRAGLFIGLAYWLRPEALTLLPLLFVRRADAGRRYWALAIAVAVALCYPVVRWILIDEFALTPKFAFMKPMGPLGAQGLPSFFGAFFDNLVSLPAKAMPGLDWVGLPFGIAGLCLLFKKDRRMAMCFLVCLLLGFCVMLAFQVKARFFLSQMPLFLLLSAVALKELPAALPVKLDPRYLYGLGIVVAFALVSQDFMLRPKLDKKPEREVGVWLGPLLAADGADAGLVTDMPRVAYFAGRHPPRPAIYEVENLRTMIEQASVKYVVLGVKRDNGSRLRLMADFESRFDRINLPFNIRRMQGSERIGVYRRRE